MGVVPFKGAGDDLLESWPIPNIRAKNRTGVLGSQWVYGQYPDVCSKNVPLRPGHEQLIVGVMHEIRQAVREAASGVGRHLWRLAFGAELASAQAVQVEVIHRHSGGRPDVESEPVTALSDAFVLGHLRRRSKHPRDERAMLASNVSGVGDMFLRDHHKVDRRARVDVQDRDYEVIFLQPVSRDLAVDYFAENTIGHRSSKARSARRRRVCPPVTARPCSRALWAEAGWSGKRKCRRSTTDAR